MIIIAMTPFCFSFYFETNNCEWKNILSVYLHHGRVR